MQQIGRRVLVVQVGRCHHSTASQVDVQEPNKVWGTDITYLRTLEGWLFLSVVMDLFSRRIIGWSMNERMTGDLALNALLMAV